MLSIIIPSGTVEVSNPVGGENFHTLPDPLWGPINLLYKGYSFIPGGKADGEWL